jgi:hypothetical protein
MVLLKSESEMWLRNIAPTTVLEMVPPPMT